MSADSASTTEYCDRIKRENNMDIDAMPEKNSPWADQVEAALNAPSSSIEEDSIPTFNFNTQSRKPHKDPLNMTPTHVSQHKASQHKASIPLDPTIIPYDESLPLDPSLWDGQFSAVSIFGTKECFDQDSANIIKSIQQAASFIRQRSLSGSNPNTLSQLSLFGDAAWSFFSAVYESQWDKLHLSNNIFFRDKVSAQFNRTPKYMRSRTSPSKTATNACAKISKIPP